MTNELLKLIDEIAKYGIQPNLTVETKEVDLERNLAKLLSLQFDLSFEFDSNDYPDLKPSLTDLRNNIESNFSKFGFYKTILDITNFKDYNDVGTGDAVDDLHDIINELLEVKWRLENNSTANGLWYLKFAFDAHIKDHILDLLKYMNELKQQ